MTAPRTQRKGRSTMIELVAIAAIALAITAGLRTLDDSPLDRVDRRLWPYLRH